jgi:hypothetical protein
MSLSKEIAIYSIFSFFIIVFLLLSNRMPDLHDINTGGFIDIYSYIEIAKIKNLNNLIELIPYHHLQRWPIHLLVGKLSSVFNINLLDVYRLFIILIMLSMSILIWQFNTNLSNKVIYLSVVILNPYSTRMYLYAPPLIHDYLFIFVLVMFILAIHNEDEKYLWISIFLSLFSRQTAIMLIPILITSSCFIPFLRKILIKFTLIALFLFLFLYVLTKQIFGSDPGSSLLFHVNGLYRWVKNPFVYGTYEFFRSFGFFIITLSPLLLLRFTFKKVPIAFIGFFYIALQPILAGPAFTGSNAARLIAYSLPFIGMLALEKKQTFFTVLLIVFLLLLNSLHHWYSNLITYDEIVYFGRNIYRIEIYGTIVSSTFIFVLLSIFYKKYLVRIISQYKK